MTLGAAAVAVHVLLTDVKSGAVKSFLTQAELPATIVVIMTYLV